MDNSESLFHPDAESEFVAAFQWYWNRNHSAADAFDDAVMSGIRLIQRNPMVWPDYVHGTKKYVVPKFPYNIVFRCIEAELQVIAVAHHRRRPAYWVDRLK
jgi:plasmid stabilization system protein ParE